MKLQIKNKKGSSMVMVLILGLFLAFAAIAVLSLVLKNLSSSRHVYQQNIAFQASEAGIERAMTNFAKKNFTTSIGPTSLSDQSEFKVTISTPKDTDGDLDIDNDDDKVIESVGYVPNATNPKIQKHIKVVATINQIKKPINLPYAVHSGNNGLIASGNVTIDGIDETGIIVPAHVFSNGPIDLSGTSDISGTLNWYNYAAINPFSCYINGCPNLKNNSKIYGIRYMNMTEAQKTNYIKESSDTIPVPFSEPSDLKEWKDICNSGTHFDSLNITNSFDPKTIPPGPIFIENDLTVKSNTTFYVRGAVWVKGTVTLENNANIILDHNNVEPGITPFFENGIPYFTFIFTEKQFSVTNNANFKKNSINTFPIIVSTSNASSWAINFNSKSADGFVGLIAPFGTIEMGGSGGDGKAAMLAGNYIKFPANGTVHWYQKLANANFHSGIEIDPKWRKKSWQIIQ